ncbi:hypothetical protein Btru_053400 [Bulinus truncatus]|nr:hypothetical protein Btru_053400 [Bulinus truncatus]
MFFFFFCISISNKTFEETKIQFIVCCNNIIMFAALLFFSKKVSPSYSVMCFRMLWRTIQLATFFVSVFAQPDKDSTDKCDRRVDVSIIGAGPAGTYAAYLLSNSSMSLELVEGTDRIGGRLHTVRLPGSEDIAIELGTMMFADSHERIRKLIQELGRNILVLHLKIFYYLLIMFVVGYLCP